MSEYKNRLLVAFFIILVSFIYGLPNIILSLKLGADYNPLTITETSPIAKDEAYAYAPQVKHILEGNYLVGDVQVEEYKNYPTPFLGETFPSIAFALLSKLTGSIQSAFIAADFIFPPVIFLFFYFLTRTLARNNLFALVVAFVAVVSRDFIAVFPYPVTTFNYLTVSEPTNYFLHYSRAFHPQFSFIVFASAITFLFKLVIKEKSKFFTILLGLVFGLLFYTYIFYWTYFVAFFGLVFLFFLIKGQNKIVLSLFISVVIALLLALPYLMNIYNFYQLPLSNDFVSKSASPFDFPIILFKYFLIGIAFLFIFSKKNLGSRRKFFNVFAIFLMTGPLLPIVSKLLLGLDLETLHYLRRALMPFATLAFFIMLYEGIKKTRLVYLFSLFIFLVFIFFALKTQITSSFSVASSHILNKDAGAVFAWFRENTTDNQVIGSLDVFFNRYVPLYTNNKVFFPVIDRTLTPTKELVERYSSLGNMLGVDSTWQIENLDKIQSYVLLFQSYSKEKGLDLESPRRKLAEKEIISLSSNSNWRKPLNKYKLDFVVITPEHLHLVSPRFDLIEPVTSIGQFVIFKSKK